MRASPPGPLPPGSLQVQATMGAALQGVALSNTSAKPGKAKLVASKASDSSGSSSNKGSRGQHKVYNVELGRYDTHKEAREGLKRLPNRYSMSSGYGYGGYAADGSYWSVHGCIDHDTDIQKTSCGVYVKICGAGDGKFALRATKLHTAQDDSTAMQSQHQDHGAPKWCYAEVVQAIELNAPPSAIHNNLRCVSSCHLVVV